MPPIRDVGWAAGPIEFRFKNGFVAGHQHLQRFDLFLVLIMLGLKVGEDFHLEFLELPHQPDRPADDGCAPQDQQRNTREDRHYPLRIHVHLSLDDPGDVLETALTEIEHDDRVGS